MIKNSELVHFSYSITLLHKRSALIFFFIMHFVILFSFWILLGNAQECDPCVFSFPDYAVCSGEDVCPLHAQFVETRCYVKNITTLVLIKQLRIRGNCGSVKQFVYFCQNIPIKDIVMLDSEENHRCKGNCFFFLYTSLKRCGHTSKERPIVRKPRPLSLSTNELKLLSADRITFFIKDGLLL